MKFTIIFNANAAGGKKLRLINRVISLLRSSHEVELFKTVSETDAKKVFDDLSKRDFDRLVIAGGDGSICFAINEMIEKGLEKKLIAYIPAGTANILQIETGIKKKAEEIYKVLISNHSKKISLAKINDKYFFLIAGVGFDSKIVKSINTNVKKYLGKIIFAYKGFMHFLFLKNEKMRVEVNNEIFDADWILCTNSKFYAGPYSITNDTNIFKPSMIAYIFKDLTRLKLLYYIYLILVKGDLSSAKSVIKKNLDEIKINKINDPLLAQVDGENCGYSEQIIIKTTNKFINLLAPKN